MKNYLLLFLLLSCSLIANTNNFSVIVDKPFNDALYDVTEDYDRTISAIGFSKSFKATNNNQTYNNAFDFLESISDSHGSQMHLLKVDNDANIKISKAAKLPKFNEAIALVKTPSNGYFVGGYTLEGSLLLAKLDTKGDILFTKLFGTSNNDTMNDLIALKDGGVLAIGSSTTTRSKNDNLFQSGLGLNDISLTRFSKDGKILWSKKYGTSYDDSGIDAVEAQDGSIIVVAKTTYDKYKNVTLMRISENGTKIWLKHYKSENTITPYKLIRLKDNNFLLSMGQKDSMQKEQIRLIKFDIQKNIILDKNVRTTYSSALKDIKEFSNSNLMAVGYVKDTYNTDALVMLLDSNLNMLYQEHYGTDNYDVFNSLHILHNSQVAAAGITTSEKSQESNMWLVKLNPDGTIAQVSTKTSSLYEELLKLFHNEIDKGQILVKKDLTIELIHKDLLFKVGQYVLTNKQKSFLDKFSKKFLTFLKTYQSSIETLEVNGHTSSEWDHSGFSDTYLNNSKLSMNRSYATLSYIFKNQNKDTQVWLSRIIRGSGFSYSKKIMVNNLEDREKSRRVAFKVIVK
jgi:outer membrane protein OmpA-like peptidoglycan-associated protein